MGNEAIIKQLQRELGFDLYGRHALIRGIIEANRRLLKRFTILDVGGRGNILQRFFSNDAVSYLDPLVETDDPNYIAGDGCNIPLPDNAFDWVVSVDTFEHILPAERQAFLKENLRVAKIGMILVAPFYSPAVHKAEIAASELYRELAGEPHPWLQEHIENGLPTLAEVQSFIQQSGYPFQVLHNNSLLFWDILLSVSFIAEVNAHPQIRKKFQGFNYFYNTKIFPLDTDTQSYRKIFFIKKNPELVDLPIVQHAIDPSLQVDLLKRAFHILSSIDRIAKEESSKKDKEIHSLGRMVRKKDADIRDYQMHVQGVIQRKDSAISALQRELQEKILKKDADIRDYQMHVQGVIQRKDSAISALQQDIHTLHAHANTLQEHVTHLAQIQEDLSRNIANLEDQIQKNASTIASQESTIASQESTIASQESTIASQESTIASQESTIAWMEASIFWKLRGIYLKGKALPANALILIQKALMVVKRDGLITALQYCWKFLRYGREYFKHRSPSETDYDQWIKRNEHYERLEVQKTIAQFAHTPTISFIAPVYNTDPQMLERCIASVRQQYYEKWELCIVDDGSTRKATLQVLESFEGKDQRMKIRYSTTNQGVSMASNEALAMASGKYIALLDHDDTIAPFALYEVVKKINSQPDVGYCYSDEDNIDEEDRRSNPFFKPDWNLDLFTAMMYTGHLSVMRRDYVEALKGFRSKFDGAQDYDLVLRLIESLKPTQIGHIPKVLYHWRKSRSSTASGMFQKGGADTAGQRALQDYVRRNKIDAVVQLSRIPGRYRIKRTVPASPLVSMIIPFRDHAEVLRRCVKSITKKTTHKNFEIILVDNQSQEQQTNQYLASLKKKNIRLISYDAPFNFSVINNHAGQQARGEYLLFLNNDTEVITPDWLEAMLEHAQRDDVGAVGAQLLYPNGTIQHAGVILLGGEVIAGHAMKYFPKSHPGYFSMLTVIRNYSAVTGACLMIKKSRFEKIGGFNERDLTTAYNDVDLCLRLGAKGFRIVYTPYATLYHQESLSRGDDEVIKATDAAAHERLQRERAYMRAHWQQELDNDPCYSPNLSHTSEDFRIAL